MTQNSIDNKRELNLISDNIGAFIILGFLGGIIGAIVLVAYQGYIWLKSGVWVGLTVRDVLVKFGLIDASSTGAIMIEGWTGLSKAVSWIATITLDASAIVGSLIIGIAILGFGELLIEVDKPINNIWKKYRKS